MYYCLEKNTNTQNRAFHQWIPNNLNLRDSKYSYIGNHRINHYKYHHWRRWSYHHIRLKSSQIRSATCSKRSSPVPGVTRLALSDGTFGLSIFQKCIPIKPQILRFFYRKQGFPLLKPSHIRSARCCKRLSPVPDANRRALPDAMFRFPIFQSVFH